MAFADPISVTIGGTATSFPRTGLSLDMGTFQTADATYKVEFSGGPRGTRTRNTMKITKVSVVADPLVPAQNIPTSSSVHIVSDRPTSTVTVADQIVLVKALLDFLTASTYANTTKFVGGEH